MFELSKSQREIQKAARDFAKGEFDKDLAIELEKAGDFPVDIWKKSADLGFIGIHLPEAYSGGGMGMLENVLIQEEFSRKDSSIGSALANASFALECISEFGSDEQKEKYIPPVVEGEYCSTGAFAESSYGYNYNEIETSAVKSGTNWLLNGTKTQVVNGDGAGVLIVLGKTDPAAESSEKGGSLFVVGSEIAGVSAIAEGRLLGNNLLKRADVIFKDVSVPESNLIGPEGRGSKQLKQFYDIFRITLAGQALGNALGSYDRVMEYIKNREQFGRKLAQFHITQHKIADMATKIELARLITYKAAWSMDNGNLDTTLSSMAKMTAARTAMEVGAQTIQLFGGYGYMTEQEVERFYRDAKAIELLAGALDTQKDNIANSVIGRM
jgi:alkylation response protein AidB-like acyl-CoA dehydrogenase